MYLPIHVNLSCYVFSICADNSFKFISPEWGHLSGTDSVNGVWQGVRLLEAQLSPSRLRSVVNI